MSHTLPAVVIEPEIIATAVPVRSARSSAETEAVASIVSAAPTITASLAELLADWLAGRSATTRRAYAVDSRAFASYLTKHEPGVTLADAVTGPQAQLNLIAHRYRAGMLDGGVAPSTVNRRLSSLRSLVKFARMAGATSNVVEIEGVKARKYRDTSGPGLPILRTLVEHLGGEDNARNRRDAAIVGLLFGCGLRRGELVALDVTSLDLSAGRLEIVGKGQREPEPITLPDEVVIMVARWLDASGAEAGPLFCSIDRHGHIRPRRLTGGGVWTILDRLSEELGVPRIRPHGLRHTAITTVLDCNGGDVRAAARFSRHADVRTLSRYDDNRADLGGEMASLAMGALLGEGVSD